MKDPIDKWLEANSPSFMPVERDERETYSPADKPKEQQLTEQQRWDNAARSMGWLHLVGMTKEDDMDEMNKRIMDSLDRVLKRRE